MGSAVHEAIDAQARGDDPYEYFDEYVSRERADRRLAYEEEVGSTPWQSEMEEFEDSANLARSLVRQYFDRYGTENPLQELGLKYVATEVPFSIPLSNGINFVGTFDGIATDIKTESKFYLTENKTAGRKPNLELVRGSNQFVGYNWAFSNLFSQAPAGTLYNVIMKNLIKEPKVLQSGKLSTDKSARVTVSSFMKALQYGNHEPTQYLAYLEMLQEREVNGDDRFFIREMFHYSQSELEDWHDTVLLPVSEQIHDPHGVNNHLDIIPNYTACEHCFVTDICGAMRRGDDVDPIVSSRYKVGKSPTTAAVDGVTPTVVRSPSELINTLKEASYG